MPLTIRAGKLKKVSGKKYLENIVKKSHQPAVQKRISKSLRRWTKKYEQRIQASRNAERNVNRQLRVY